MEERGNFNVGSRTPSVVMRQKVVSGFGRGG